MSYNSQLSVLTGKIAKVAKLVDALDLGSSASRRESSSLSFRTTCCKSQVAGGSSRSTGFRSEAFVI